MENFDENARPVVVCVSEGILAAVGGAAALEAAGVSPQLFGVVDDLTELGIAIDPAAVDVVAGSAASCGLGGLVAAEIVTGFTDALRQVAVAIFGADPQRGSSMTPTPPASASSSPVTARSPAGSLWVSSSATPRPPIDPSLRPWVGR